MYFASKLFSSLSHIPKTPFIRCKIMCGSADRDPPPPACPVAHHSNPFQDQYQHQEPIQRTKNPPPPPPLPPTSSMRSRPGRSHHRIGNESIPLQQLSQPGPSRTDGQQSGLNGQLPSRRDVLEAVEAVAKSFNNTNIKYAIVGGAGLVAPGSQRITNDVDFVICPPTALKEAKNELRKDPRFAIDPRTRHTTFTSSSGRAVEIEALSSPGTFKGRFDDSTPLMTVLDEVQLFNALLYLESKCGSLPGRTSDKKRRSDAQDIFYLLNFMVDSNIRTNSSEIPSATPAFIAGFERISPGTRGLFHRVGLA
jgi:hypothetical protein